jgi:DNA-binding transcriptional regulator GbsR (MarR family)
MAHKAPAELRELAGQIGKFIQYWGFKKIHGQIWSYIFLAKQPVDATSLVQRMSVSKTLVSLAIKDLLKYDVIRIAGKGPRRKILFESNPNLIEVICSVLKHRERVLLQGVQEAFDKVTKLDCSSPNVDIDSDKLDELGDMIHTASETLDALIQTDLNFQPHPTADAQ